MRLDSRSLLDPTIRLPASFPRIAPGEGGELRRPCEVLLLRHGDEGTQLNKVDDHVCLLMFFDVFVVYPVSVGFGR